MEQYIVFDEKTETVDYLESARAAGFNETELGWLPRFWDPVFNKSFIYMPKQRLVEWLGHANGNDNCVYSGFVRKLKAHFIKGIDYVELDRNADLVKSYESLLRERTGTKIDERAKNRMRFYAISGETFKMLLMQAQTELGAQIRRYYIKVEQLATAACSALLEFSRREREQARAAAEQMRQENEALKSEQHETCARAREMLDRCTENVREREAKQVIYVAAAPSMAALNCFKVGGCESERAFGTRLSTYNTGRLVADHYYFCYKASVVNYRHVEARVKELLSKFVDDRDKEIYVMHFDYLKLFLDRIIEGYSDDVAEFNRFVRESMRAMMATKPIIPPPIEITQPPSVQDGVQVRRIRAGAPAPTISDGGDEDSRTIDFVGLSREQQNAAVLAAIEELRRASPAVVQEVNGMQIVPRKSLFELMRGTYAFKAVPAWNAVKQLVLPAMRIRW